MSRRAPVRTSRRGRVLALLAVGLSAVFATSALAESGNRVHNDAPSHVTVGQTFTVHLKGHASRRAWLYLWLDSRHCAPTPAGEHKRLTGDVWKLAGGTFDKASKWKAVSAGTTHVCSYLSKRSVPENSPHGVVAHDFTTIRQTG